MDSKKEIIFNKLVNNENDGLVKLLEQSFTETNDAANYVYEGGDTLLHLAAKYDNGEIIKLLLKNNFNKEAVNNDGATPLHCAASNNGVDAMNVLIKDGADKEAMDVDGLTPLHYAAGSNCIDSIKILLENGANINSRDNSKLTPLHFASGKNKVDAIKILIEYGADKEARGENGWTPLHTAALLDEREAIELLIKSGADKDARDEKGGTPLHIVAIMKMKKSMKELIKQGADCTIKNYEGKTCLELLLEYDLTLYKEMKHFIMEIRNSGMVDILERLQDLEDMDDLIPRIEELVLKEDINTVDSGGMTVLHWAAAHRKTEIMKRLIEIGGDYTIQDERGKTCIDMLGSEDIESIRKIRTFILEIRMLRASLSRQQTKGKSVYVEV